MIEDQYELKLSERFPKEMEVPERADILIELSRFGIGSANAIQLIDTTHDALDVRLNYIIRPLAKLSKAVKVADTGNQGKAESKALSAVTVTLREDTESFKKTDGVFNKDTFS